MTGNITSGLVNFRQELMRELSRDCDVVVLAADTGRTDELDAMGIRFVPMQLSRHGFNPVEEFRSVAFYARAFAAIRPDVVLTYTIKPNIYAGIAAAKLGIPQIANVTGLGPAFSGTKILKLFFTHLYRHGLRRAQRVFFQNRSDMDFMLRRKMVRKVQCGLLPGSGVNLDRFHLLPYPDGPTVDFLFLSRIVREKGIEQFLDAARHTKAKHPETRFHVCGTCEQHYEPLLRQLHEAGTIVYHGRVKDVPAMHAVCACTIHPSFYPEGMSNVLLEACACGRPVITTDRPGCREAVDDGVNGFLVRPGDARDLIEKVEAFLELPPGKRREMGFAGRIKVEKEFDRRIVVDRYLEEIGKAGCA
jgi:galacturonosyltransferase